MSVTPQHEALHRIFQHDPGLYSHAVDRVLGIKLATPSKLTELNVDITEIRPLERRADSVFEPSFRKGGPVVVPS